MSAPRRRGRPKEFTEPRVGVMVRMPPGLHARLAEEAADRDIAVNRLVCSLLVEGLDHLIPVDELITTRRPR